MYTPNLLPTRRSVWTPEVEPHPDPVDGAALLDELADLVRRHVVLPEWGPETLALWILHTYAFELRDVSAYLGIESPEKRCGKTTLLAVLGELVNRPVIAANISSPAFFRVIEELRPTLLIDEADTLLRGNDELRGILNAGYGRKTAFVMRVTSQGPENQDPAPAGRNASETEAASRLARFSCWCPKAIAAIGRLPETLADRCILLRMQRKARTESCERLRDLEAAGLRRRCVRFVRDRAAAIAAARPATPPALNDRAADIWEPLLVLSDLAGGGWPDRARQAAAVLATDTSEGGPVGSLLFDILVIFTVIESDRRFSVHLVEDLNTFTDRPWQELTRGRPLDDRMLARLLWPYGISPRSLRIGELRSKGYYREDFRPAFGRYIPRSEYEAFKAERAAIIADKAEAAAQAQAQPEAQTQPPPANPPLPGRHDADDVSPSPRGTTFREANNSGWAPD